MTRLRDGDPGTDARERSDRPSMSLSIGPVRLAAAAVICAVIGNGCATDDVNAGPCDPSAARSVAEQHVRAMQRGDVRRAAAFVAPTGPDGRYGYLKAGVQHGLNVRDESAVDAEVAQFLERAAADGYVLDGVEVTAGPADPERDVVHLSLTRDGLVSGKVAVTCSTGRILVWSANLDDLSASS